MYKRCKRETSIKHRTVKRRDSSVGLIAVSSRCNRGRKLAEAKSRSACVTRATSERVQLVGEEIGAEGKPKKGGRRPFATEECRRGRRERNPLWVWAELSEARASRRHRLASWLASANPSLSGHVGRVPGAEHWVPVPSLRPCHVFHARAPFASSSSSSFSFSSSIASSSASSASWFRRRRILLLLLLLHHHLLHLLCLLPLPRRVIARSSHSATDAPWVRQIAGYIRTAPATSDVMPPGNSLSIVKCRRNKLKSCIFIFRSYRSFVQSSGLN